MPLPHARGGEPLYAETAGLRVELFPTHVGVNRHGAMLLSSVDPLFPTHVGVNLSRRSWCRERGSVFPTHVGVNRRRRKIVFQTSASSPRTWG